jgi:RNA polymerase sigma factor (sigma-70 family)
MHASDQELLALFSNAATREQGFTQLVKKYQEKIYWHIRRMVIDHADADDVLQNTLIKIWKGLENFREESQLFTWLYRIATNETLSFLAQQQRKATQSLDEITESLANMVKADIHFNANQLEWRLQLAIQELPEKQRVVFHLRYYDAMPYEEMSKVLDTSEGALKASYHHAAKKIEAFIKNY